MNTKKTKCIECGYGIYQNDIFQYIDPKTGVSINPLCEVCAKHYEQERRIKEMLNTA
jgi:NAD-dependent SIR2 family protein deacetylase